MLSRIRRLPSPALVTSAIALIVAVGGGTFALGSSDGKKDKKIANKVVTMRAESLSVLHASTADSASTADTATSADNAANAANADNLGGRAPAAYLDRVSERLSGTNSIALTSGVRTDITFGGPASITVPSGVNFVEAVGTASVNGSTADWIIWVEQDAPCASGSGLGFNNRPFGNPAGTQDSLTQDIVFSVTPGEHQYLLCGESGGSGASVVSRTLVVHTIPVGATGAMTLDVRSSGSSGSSGHDTTP